MNKDNAHLFLPLVQALADGKTIQLVIAPGSKSWMDMENVDFSCPVEEYRIKPEPVHDWLMEYNAGGEWGNWNFHRNITAETAEAKLARVRAANPSWKFRLRRVEEAKE